MQPARLRNTITSKNRSHIPYQHLQWLIKYLSDHLNTSTGPSIIPLPEFTYYNLQWKSQASCKATDAWNSRRSRFSLVSCLKGQIPEQTLLLESKILWEIKAAAFRVFLFCQPASRDINLLVATGEQTYLALVPVWGELRQGSSSPGEGGTAQGTLLSGSAQLCVSRGMQQERLTNHPAFEDSQAWPQSHAGSSSVADESNTHGLRRQDSQTS